jgi:hypothetical protein
MKAREMSAHNKYVPPSISQTAFNCPHCSALSSQNWFVLYPDQINKTPFFFDQIFVQQFLNDEQFDDDDKVKLIDKVKKYALIIYFMMKIIFAALIL